MKDILSKYGGEEHLNLPDEVKISTFKEKYEEYDKKG
jgi:hypothetical protein